MLLLRRLGAPLLGRETVWHGGLVRATAFDMRQRSRPNVVVEAGAPGAVSGAIALPAACHSRRKLDTPGSVSCNATDSGAPLT